MSHGNTNILSLCSGAGGLELGLQLALKGARTVGYVEREAYAQATLLARMEDKALEQAPVFSDLRAFNGRPWRGVVDIVTAGYPCQPFSYAGKRLGKEDERHLWPHVRRIVSQVRPNYVFLENVRGHLSMGFDRVLSDLARLGFDAEWCVVGAADVGAPHRRQRLFVLAHADSQGLEKPRHDRQRELQPETRPGIHDRPRLESGELAYTNSGGRRGIRGNGVREGEQEHGETQIGGGDLDGRDLWPPSPGDIEAWSRVPPEAQPSIRGVADGMASRVDRLRLCGNGVVPLAAAYAFRTLLSRITG